LNGKRPPEREREVIACIVQGLTLLGYVCLRCGQWRADRAGTDAGVPDLLVSSARWPEGVWLGLEAKGARTPLNAAQRALVRAGRLFIVRSWEDAIAAVRAFEESRTGKVAPGVPIPRQRGA
jgi:hypothetical protein